MLSPRRASAVFPPLPLAVCVDVLETLCYELIIFLGITIRIVAHIKLGNGMAPPHLVPLSILCMNLLQRTIYSNNAELFQYCFSSNKNKSRGGTILFRVDGYIILMSRKIGFDMVFQLMSFVSFFGITAKITTLSIDTG